VTAKAIHSMIRVLDETRSVEFYRKAFDLEVVNRYDFGEFVLVYLANSATPFELELTINKGRTEPYALGDGYGHLAFAVEDLDAERARLEAAGAAPRPIAEFKRDDARFARFFFVQDPDGYKIEVLQRGGRFG
jgi:lactoylglutathione lyase